MKNSAEAANQDCKHECPSLELSAQQIFDMVLKLSEDIDQELWGPEGSKSINARGRIVPLISSFANALLSSKATK